MGVPKLARMSESATLTIVMSIIAISAAAMTTAVMPALEPVTVSLSMAVASLLRGDGHLRAQSRAELEPGVRVEADEHRHALHDLREVAGCVVGREQREARTRAAREAIDVPQELLARYGV